MNCVLVVHSYHHMNTYKVAEAFAEVLECQIETTESIEPEKIKEYDLVGFGAGIDSGVHYKELIEFAEALNQNESPRNCFIFSTSGVQGDRKVAKDHRKLRDILKSKEFNIVGEFSCLGFNTNVFLKYIGGINKKHPSQEDLDNAKEFVRALQASL